MKVHELKEILNNYDDTADVFFFTGYSTIPYYELLDRQEIFNLGISTPGIAMEIEAAERLDTINTLILTPTGEEFKQANDRETWQGDFNSREEAMQAAISDENTKEYLAVYTGIAKLYTPALKSETVLDILKIEADEIAGIAAADWLKLEDISEEACSELEKNINSSRYEVA